MNPAFATHAFWQPYFHLEPDDVTDEDFAAQWELLRRDFPVREETTTVKKGRNQRVYTDRFVEFEFACPAPYSISLEYEAAEGGCRKELALKFDASRPPLQLGWWDTARWHPYCLRQGELDALVRYWHRHDPRWTTPEVPFLLLCQFVGLPDAAAEKALAQRAATACRRLGLPKSNDDEPTVPLYVPDDHYRWEHDPQLGWVFTSDEYACYSVRNPAHAGGEEAAFPFEEFGELMARVNEALGE